jgi:hypothetical protein
MRDAQYKDITTMEHRAGKIAVVKSCVLPPEETTTTI